ncbi:MAG: FAD-dependent oxidoreductase, partial [Chloroflexus aggregans]
AARVAFHVGRVLPIARQVRSHVWAIGAYNGTGNVIGALCGRAVAFAAVRDDDRLLNLLAGERA